MPFQFHLPLQLVGGVGRSLVSWLLAQWALLIEPTRLPLLFDADPWGGWAFRGRVAAKPFGDLAFGDHVDQRLLDKVVEQMVAVGGRAILDPGAAVVRDVAEYFLLPAHSEAIVEYGQMVAHLIVLGGARQHAAVASAIELSKLLPPAVRVVLWRNDYFDGIDREALQRQLASFPRHIDAAIDLPHHATDLARDLIDVLSLKLSISEAVATGKVSIMASRRLFSFLGDLVARLACLGKRDAPSAEVAVAQVDRA